jgi:transcriptional regulator with XRE-family HTH domain
LSCPSDSLVPRRTAADPIAHAFGSAVRRTREARGETLEDVAGRVARLDPRYLGELELGWHAATIITAKRIADALETPLAELVRDL